MLDQQIFKKIGQYLILKSHAEETEALIISSQNALTRFANNIIHQNVVNEDLIISIRTVFGKKIGVASGNLQIEKPAINTLGSNLKAALDKLLSKSEEIAKKAQEDSEFAGLPFEKTAQVKQKIKSVFNSTLNFTANERAKAVDLLIKKAEKEGLTAFGSVQNSYTQYAIANSNGIFKYFPVTQGAANLRVFNNDRSGYAGFTTSNISEINFIDLAKTAIDKAMLNKKTREIKPGEYEVVLEEPAVAEIMQFLAYLGFGAKNYYEGSSFLSGKMGRKVLSEQITIDDDSYHSLTIPALFDYEGLSKRKIRLIEKGKLTNIVYDYQYGQKYKKKPTGHGLPAPNTEGPFPLHLVLAFGKVSRQKLISKVKKGILVTRFWYVNPIHPKLLNITGMTRDGTFLIENGEITGVLRNLRFMQSIPEALSNVRGISIETKAEEGIGGGTVVVPAIHLGKWNFTGESKL